MVEINKNEAKRYLGYRGITELDASVDRMLDDCIREVREKAEPREVHMTFPILWDADRRGCSFAGIHVPVYAVNAAEETGAPGTADAIPEETDALRNTDGENGSRQESGLIRNLRGCSEIVLLAVTIGPEPDRLVRRAEIRNMLQAYCYQAVGAACVEAWCEEVNERIRLEAAEKELFTRPRFSPGYGDFPLTVQRDFERILEMPKKIGVSLSESLLMTPTKSITAVIGLSSVKTDCHRAGCEECNMAQSCAFSRA